MTLAAAAGVIVPPGAAAASSPDSLFIPRAPTSLVDAPPGYRLTANGAVAAATRSPRVQKLLANGPMKARAFTFGRREWQVSLFRGGKEVARVEVDDRADKVLGVWTGHQIEWPLARGAHGPRTRRLHLFMVLAGILFLVPYVRPRRLWRLGTLDLLVLLSFGVSQFFSARGQLEPGVWLAYPPLLYLLIRLGALACGRPHGRPSLETWMSPRMLATGLVALLALRYGYDIVDSSVNDVGYASLYGADSILSGVPLYDSSPGSGNLDTYGPIAYLAYLPFDLIFPLVNLSHDHVTGARAAAIVFDLATVAGLLVLGRRLAPGESGRRLGLALAWGWAAFPWTLFVLSSNTNDGLVAMFLVWSLVAAGSPIARGALLGFAGAAKFAPLVLVGIFSRGPGERGLRQRLVFAVALLVVLVVSVVPYLPENGLRGFYDATIGFQLGRSSPFSLWGLHPELAPLHTVLTAAVAAAAAAAFVIPSRRGRVELAAGGAALIIATQILARHWYYFYLPWFLAFALVAFLAPRGLSRGQLDRPDARALVSP